MSGIDWQDVARFGELACGSLDPVAVQRRTLPDFIRLLQADSGAIHLIDHRYQGLVATTQGAPVRMLVDFESMSRRTNVYLQQSIASRFPVHDAMIHGRAIDHRRSPEGLAEAAVARCRSITFCRGLAGSDAVCCQSTEISIPYAGEGALRPAQVSEGSGVPLPCHVVGPAGSLSSGLSRPATPCPPWRSALPTEMARGC